MNVDPYEETVKSAMLSEDGLYRYELRRTWSRSAPMTWVMLNPSTADAAQDDPTIRRCMGFARREGCGGIVVVNLFALRVTRPVHLFDGSIGLPNGPHNRGYVANAFDVAATTDGARFVVAWGALKRPWRSTAHSWLMAHLSEGHPVLCLGKTADGSPRHPLYLRADTPLEVWP